MIRGSRYDFPGVDHEGRQTCRFLRLIVSEIFHFKFSPFGHDIVVLYAKILFFVL